jgi:methenyltetrahydrofolate cyclohydrolase
VSFRDTTLEELLGQLEAPGPSPCGGATAALTAAMAGSLVAMVARGAPAWEEGASVAERATELRDRLVDLAWADTQAVAGLLELKRLPEDERAQAIERAIESPAAIHSAAQEVAALAELAESHGKPVMRADATAARLLAAAAAQVAAEIMATNQSS